MFLFLKCGAFLLSSCRKVLAHFFDWLAAVMGDIVDLDVGAVSDLVPEDYADLAEEGLDAAMDVKATVLAAKDTVIDAKDAAIEPVMAAKDTVVDAKDAAIEIKEAAKELKKKTMRKIYETTLFFPKEATRFERMGIIMHVLNEYGFDDARGDL